MRVSDKYRSPARIHCCDAAPTPTGFAEIVSDDFSATRAQAIDFGRQAKIFTANALAQPFTIYTRIARSLGNSDLFRDLGQL
jgi:hypothetical protein